MGKKYTFIPYSFHFRTWRVLEMDEWWWWLHNIVNTLMPLNYTFKKGGNGKFYIMHSYTIFKNNIAGQPLSLRTGEFWDPALVKGQSNKLENVLSLIRKRGDQRVNRLVSPFAHPYLPSCSKFPLAHFTLPPFLACPHTEIRTKLEAYSIQ